MKHFLLILLIFSNGVLKAQLNEDFSDGDFITNPSWAGSTGGADFTISDGKLRSNSSVANTGFFLSTENRLANNVQWEFWVNLQFNTSGSNYADIYVISDKADLKSTQVNGYFVRIGNTDDEISLYKRSGSTGSSIKIIDGVNGSIGSSNNTVKIRLKRDSIGKFTLEREVLANNSSYYTEGTVIDLTHAASTHFGIFIQQSTASFFLKHYFDNIKIIPIVTDTIPPTVTSVTKVDSNSVEITFSEVVDSISAKLTSNYSITGNAPPILKILTTSDPTKFRLELAASLNSGTYLVSVSNVKDKNENLISENNNGSFTYAKPYIAKFGDITFNEIFVDPTPQIDLPSVEFAELRNNTTEQISLKNWKFSDSGNSATFGEISIDPHSFLIICAKADTAEYKSFGRVHGLSPWPSLNNSGETLKLSRPENSPIDSVRYSDKWYRSSIKKQGGWTLERKHPSSRCEDSLNWFASIDSAGGTPGKENSIYVIAYDILPLRVDSLRQLSDTTIKLYFNKYLNSATLTTENFSLNPKTSPARKITSESDFTEVIITYDQRFRADTEYTLTIENVKDCYGVPFTAIPGELKFKTNKPTPVTERPDTAKLAITEIFADPSPEVHLPLSEFIEIHNPTTDTIDLDKWTICDPTTKATIRGQKILPLQYVILCPIADTLLYTSYGKTIGLNPWPSLNNNHDQVVLKNNKNRVVDSVAYSDSWYHSVPKRLGGWSIEKIDMVSVCEDLFKWTASIDTNGGTPGKRNSVNLTGYNTAILQADSLKLISDTAVRLYFNKHLDSTTLIAKNFTLNPENSIKRIIADAELKDITLIYDAKFRAGTGYEISVSNVKDCAGNSINSQTLKFHTNRPTPPVLERIDTSSVIITEVFADPSPEVNLPLVEFIEIYNPSKDTVDLDKWTINDPTTQITIRGQKILPHEYVVFCPIADTLLFKSYGRAIGLNPWISLNNSSDQLSLKSFKNRLVDSVAYSDSWYHNNSKKAGGWSLEKIDLSSVCENPFNWAASIDTNGGTPGKKNSVNITGYDKMLLVADSIKLISDTTVRLYFNKHLNSATIVADHFKLVPATPVKKIISDAALKEVTITYDKKLHAGTEYQISISNLKDCSGNSITNSHALKFTISLPPPLTQRIDTARILITEIFADPSPEIGLPLAEFIELYNPGTEVIDLNKWTISDAATSSVIADVSIAPGEYLILCATADTVSFKHFGKTKGIAPWPSLGNRNDQIMLRSFKQRLVDSVLYDDRWYKDRLKKGGGWSLEKINLLNNSCNGFYNWSSSIDPSGGTPGGHNSISRTGTNQRPIKIDSVRHTSDSTVILHLNSIADTLHLKTSQFIINNEIGKAIAISIEESFMKIHLTFRSKFHEGITYTLTADSLFNCVGEKIMELNNRASFSIPVIPELNYPILINEILADPSPQIGLPEIEFVELYNPTERPVSLIGMIYGDEGIEYQFTSGEIAAKSYLILCPEKDTLSFSRFGSTFGLPVWPSLANEKDVLILKNNKNRELHRVAYNSGWYKDPEKKTGGYSLERINTASICAGFQNWAASKDLSGGTPGKENSIHNNAPAEPLKLLETVFKDSITILLTFNKSIDSLSALALNNYHINNGIGTPDSVLPLSPEFEQVLLKLKVPPARGHTYKVEVKDLKDCSGLIISPSFNTSEITLTEKILKNAVLVNEVLFNPRPGGEDFVEIYNNTKHALDLQDLSIGTIVKDTISNVKRISVKQLLFEPGDYLTITSNPEIIKKEYRVENPDRILKGTLPPLNDDKGTVVLLSNGVRIDQFNYTDKMHFQLLKNIEGVSLERSSFELGTNAAGNFRSATAASGFATPGYKNSQYNSDSAGNDEFTLLSRTFSPDNDGFEDLLQVSYSMPVPGMVANVKIFNDQGILIKNLLKNSTLNTKGTFSWDGLDDFDAAADTGIYFMYAEIFDTTGTLKRYRRSFALAVKL